MTGTAQAPIGRHEFRIAIGHGDVVPCRWRHWDCGLRPTLRPADCKLIDTHNHRFGLLGVGQQTNRANAVILQHDLGRLPVELADGREMGAVAGNLHLHRH